MRVGFARLRSCAGIAAWIAQPLRPPCPPIGIASPTASPGFDRQEAQQPSRCLVLAALAPFPRRCGTVAFLVFVPDEKFAPKFLGGRAPRKSVARGSDDCTRGGALRVFAPARVLGEGARRVRVRGDRDHAPRGWHIKASLFGSVASPRHCATPGIIPARVACLKREIAAKARRLRSMQSATLRACRSRPPHTFVPAKSCRTRVGRLARATGTGSRSPRMGPSVATPNSLWYRDVLGSWEQGKCKIEFLVATGYSAALLRQCLQAAAETPVTPVTPSYRTSCAELPVP